MKIALILLPLLICSCLYSNSYIDKKKVDKRIRITMVHPWSGVISKLVDRKWYPEFEEYNGKIVANDYPKECTGSLYTQQQIDKVTSLAKPRKTYEPILFGYSHKGEGGYSGVTIKTESTDEIRISLICAYFVLAETKEKLATVFSIHDGGYRFNLFGRTAIYNPNDLVFLRNKLLNSKSYYLEAIFSLEERATIQYFKGRWFFGDWQKE